MVKEGRDYLTKEMKKLGCKVYGSQRPDESGWEEKTELNINAGNFDIEITQSSANALENANITVGGGAFTAPVDTKFIDASKTAASLTSGENTTYYIGNAESIAQTLETPLLFSRAMRPLRVLWQALK